MLDYLKWRGDLPFSAAPVNELDMLLFSQLAYLRFRDAIGAGEATLGGCPHCRNLASVHVAAFLAPHWDASAGASCAGFRAASWAYGLVVSGCGRMAVHAAASGFQVPG